jgi:hypothetical protein
MFSTFCTLRNCSERGLSGAPAGNGAEGKLREKKEDSFSDPISPSYILKSQTYVRAPSSATSTTIDNSFLNNLMKREVISFLITSSL